MVLNKLLNSLSSEELLKRLDEENNTDLIIESNDIQLFFSIFKLQPGTHPITSKLLYSLYRLWANKPLKKWKFGVEAGHFIPRSTNDSYLLNILPSELKLILEKLRTKPRNKIKSKAYKNRYENFLSHYSIKPGNFWIEDYILFYLYDKERYQAKKPTQFSLVTFTKMSRLFFKSKFVFKKSIWYFKVDESILDHLSKETINNLKQSRERQNEKETNKKK